MGLAFQVVDDILDVTADSATLGKTAGKDAAQDKPTYVSLLGLDRSRAYAQELLAQALARAGRQRLARHTGFTGTGDDGGEQGQLTETAAMASLLETINDPADLRKLPRAQLRALADELRAFVLDSVSRTGGHLSSNLGTVELTIALHYVFNTPYDRLVWDVGHQTYPHKILTGRRDRMGSAAPAGRPVGLSRSAAKASTTPSAPRIRPPAFPRRWAWRWPPGTRARTARPWPSSATAR